jgi:hypothetical protein
LQPGLQLLSLRAWLDELPARFPSAERSSADIAAIQLFLPLLLTIIKKTVKIPSIMKLYTRINLGDTWLLAVFDGYWFLLLLVNSRVAFIIHLAKCSLLAAPS